jgi:hypothetical protein
MALLSISSCVLPCIAYAKNNGDDHCNQLRDNNRQPRRLELDRRFFRVHLSNPNRSVAVTIGTLTKPGKVLTKYGPIILPTLYPTNNAPIAKARFVPPAILCVHRLMRSEYGAPNAGSIAKPSIGHTWGCHGAFQMMRAPAMMGRHAMGIRIVMMFRYRPYVNKASVKRDAKKWLLNARQGSLLSI